MILTPQKTRIFRMREVEKVLHLLLKSAWTRRWLKVLSKTPRTATDTQALAKKNSPTLTGVKRTRGQQTALRTQ